MSGAPRPLARLFVALWLPSELARELGEEVGAVLRGARELRLVRPEELHLTLLFLGEVERERVPALERELAAGLEAARAPRLRLAEPGCFPARGRPRVWWLGLAEDEPRLAALHAAIRAAAVRAGWSPAERRSQAFAPHLTLARTRERARAPRALEAAFRELRVEGRWTAGEALLVESQPGAGAQRYLAVRRFALAGDGGGVAAIGAKKS